MFCMWFFFFSGWRKKWLYIATLKSLDAKLKIFGACGWTVVSYEESSEESCEIQVQ